MAISKETITTVAFDEERGCYESGLFIVNSSTETSLTSTDIQTGERATSHFEMDGNALIVEEDGLELPFVKAQCFKPYPGCESFYGVTNVEFDLELSYLPPSVKINRNAQDIGRVEYNYETKFDINRNNVVDAGDIAIRVRHFKGKDNYPSDHDISIVELGSNIWTYLPKHQSDSIISSTIDVIDTAVQLTQSDNDINESLEGESRKRCITYGNNEVGRNINLIAYH